MVSAHFELLCDAFALLHHEARNVRHLVRAGFLPREQWCQFISLLPANRKEAWVALAEVRELTMKDGTVEGVLAAYRRRFGVTLDDLKDMFSDPHWRHASSYGGNAWARIAAITKNLVEALVSGHESWANQLAAELRASQHNNGGLLEKLEKLKAFERSSSRK